MCEVTTAHPPTRPVPHLSVFGVGDDAVAVARLALRAGFDVTVRAVQANLDARQRVSEVAPVDVAPLDELIARLDGHAVPFAIVVTHDYDQARNALAALLQSRARHIGVVGTAQCTRHMLSEIAYGSPISPERLRKVHGPDGQNLGGEGPEAIVLTIATEAQALLDDQEAGLVASQRTTLPGAELASARIA